MTDYLSMLDGQAFAYFSDIDLSVYQTGEYRLLVEDSAGKIAYGNISSIKPKGETLLSDLFDQETLGSELVTNGDFADWTGDDPDDWSVDNEDANNYVTESSGRARLISDNSAILTLRQAITTVVGTVYKVTFTTVVNTLGWRFLVQSGYAAIPIANYTSEGSQTFYFIAGSTTTTIYFYRHNGGASDYIVDDVVCKAVTSPAKGIPTNDPWPALAGAELITDQNNRDFSSGTIGDWLVATDGSGTCTYDTTDIGGADNKQGLLTSDTDLYLFAAIDQTRWGISANTLFRVSAKMYVPAANTLKSVVIKPSGGFVGAHYNNSEVTLSGDTWTEVASYIWIASDTAGGLLFGFNGNPADGDLLYFDDISIRKVQFSWIPFNANTIEIDETNDALKITGVDSVYGAELQFRDSYDLTDDLEIDKLYKLTFNSKIGSGNVVQGRIRDGSDNTLDLTGNIAESFTDYSMYFTATATTTNRFAINSLGVGEIFYGRNFIVKEVTDPPVTGARIIDEHSLQNWEYVESGFNPNDTLTETIQFFYDGKVISKQPFSGDYAGLTRRPFSEDFVSVDGETIIRQPYSEDYKYYKIDGTVENITRLPYSEDYEMDSFYLRRQPNSEDYLVVAK